MTVLHTQQILTVSTPEGDRQMAYQLWQPLAGSPQAVEDESSRRLVVCAHGLTRNSRDFDFIARELAHNAVVVCIDVLGRGDSEYLQDGSLYGYPLYVSQCQQLLAHLHQEFGFDRCQWLGTSMGGLIGMMLAAYQTADSALQLSQLVLNDVGSFIPRRALMRIAMYLGQPRQFASVTEVELYLRDVARPFGPLTDDQWRHLAEHGCEEVGVRQYRLRYDPAIAKGFNDISGDIDLTAIWQLVAIPTLLIRGADSDLLLADTAAEMAVRDDVELVEFAGVGHAPMLMAEDQIDCVLRFLN